MKKIVMTTVLALFLVLNICSASPPTDPAHRTFPVQISIIGDYPTLGPAPLDLGFLLTNPDMMAPHQARDGGMFPTQTINTYIGYGWNGTTETLLGISSGYALFLEDPGYFCLMNISLNPESGLLDNVDVIRNTPVQPSPRDRLKPLYCDISIQGQKIIVKLSCREDNCNY